MHAFELVGVRLEQIGSLPEAPAVAEAFVTICREAATNAVKHGQARNVRIAFEESSCSYTLRVTNDGLAGPSDFREGTGLPEHARGRWRGRRHLPGDGNPAFHARSGGSTVE